MKKMQIWRGASAILAAVLAPSIFLSSVAFQIEGSINAVLGIETGTITGSTGETIYESEYGELSDANLEKLLADEIAFCEQQMEEGAVLLKNDNNALPLASNERKVTLFGRASADPVYKDHAGGGVVSASSAVSLKEALESAGFSINSTLYNAYANSSTARVTGGSEGTSDIGEESISFYTNAIKSTFSQYNDAAIVVLAREGGEGMDFNTTDVDGVPQLSLHQDEKDMLDMIYQSGEFDKIIVLINSGTSMEVDWLDEYHVDACLWVGEPGRYGFTGLADILTGDANPSGKLVDTFAADSTSAPAMQNWGNYTFSNDSQTYVVYQEGIYVGYKYYETRYEDVVLNRYGASSNVGTYASAGSWDYAAEVSYPFGYGLSYTTFEQTLDSLEYKASSDEFVATVTVTNTGSVSGKSVVELYAQSPYTDYDIQYGVEKASVQLAGFAKTDELKSGESQTVTVTVDRYLIASYDDTNAKTYILDAGDYYFSVGDNAHDALNNILAAKGASGMTDIFGNAVDGNAAKTAVYTLDSLDDTTYATSKWTGNEVTNVFTDEYSVNVNDFYNDDPVTYLTRSDWSGTYPTGAVLTMNEAVSDSLVSRYYEQDTSYGGLTDDMINGVDAGITFVDMYGVDYDDAKWDTFLSQLSVNDMATIISDSLGEPAITSVSKPANKNADGPAGYGMNLRYGDQDSPTCYVIPNLAASSWNIELMERFGELYGEDCLYSRGQLAWAPGCDMHRTPYGGRNAEYYSEDSVLSYLVSAAQVKGMQSKGAIAAPKHFVGNDQEINRSGIATYMTEQTVREINLRAFEGAFTVGGAGGTMLSMGRLGSKMTPVNKALITDVLMEEWGFTGVVFTDSSGSESDRIPTVECLLAGTSNFCLARRTSVMESAVVDNNDAYLYEVLKEANHRFYYTYVNSNLVNGLSADTVVSNVTPWWKPAIIIADCVVGAILLFCVGEFVYHAYVKKDGKKKSEQE